MAGKKNYYKPALWSLRDPAARVLEDLDKDILGGSGRGVVVVLPSRGQGHGREDGLDARAGCGQAKLGAAVVHEIELDIAPPSELLPLFF